MRSLASIEVGEELPELRRVVTRDDVIAYADASGDHNPLHQDDAFARSVGFDGIIAHGMFTMGHMAACALAWMGETQTAAPVVVKLSAQFRATVFMGDELVAGGRVRAFDPETGSVTLHMWVTVTRDETLESPIRRGEVVLRLG
jgi:acyl dehydratase